MRLFQVTCRGSATHFPERNIPCILYRYAIPSGSVICEEEDSFSSGILILNMHGSYCMSSCLMSKEEWALLAHVDFLPHSPDLYFTEDLWEQFRSETHKKQHQKSLIRNTIKGSVHPNHERNLIIFSVTSGGIRFGNNRDLCLQCNTIKENIILFVVLTVSERWFLERHITAELQTFFWCSEQHKSKMCSPLLYWNGQYRVDLESKYVCVAWHHKR